MNQFDQRGREAIAKLAALSLSQAKPVLPAKRPGLPQLETLSAAALSAMQFEPVPHIVEGLLTAGLTVFAAPAKTGKSWFCFALAEAVSLGKPFFGRHSLASEVLYLSFEDRENRIQNRMRLMGCIPSERLYVAFKSKDLRDGLLDQLEAWRTAHPEVRLIILDTLGRIKGASPRGVDAYTADSQLLAPLQEWALSKGIAVLIVTHLNKQARYAVDADPYERITGSNGQFGVADSAWLITGKRDEEQRHLIITGRDIESQDLVITFSKANLRWQCIGDAEEVQRKHAIQSPIVRTIISLLDENDGKEVRITSSGIIDESMRRYGSCENLIPSQLGRMLRGYERLFFEARISYIPPRSNGGAGGRLHRFCRVRVPVNAEQTAL